MRNYKKILVIGHSNIGDVCYDLAVIAPLTKAFPDAQLSFLTSPRSEELIRGYPGISRIFLLDRRAGGELGYASVIRALRRERFDLAVVLKSSYMHLLIGAKDVWKVRKGPSSKHVADVYLDLLRSRGISAAAEFDHQFTYGELKSADNFLRLHGLSDKDKLVGILPLANWSQKCWHISNWNRLIEELVRRCGVRVIIFGKSSNDPYTREAIAGISRLAISAVDKCSIKETMALIKRCRLFLSSDTSLLHLASTLGVPCIGLFAATPVGRYYPYFSLEGVIQSSATLACMPCTGTGNVATCKAAPGRAPCMEAIKAEEVIKKAEQFLK